MINDICDNTTGEIKKYSLLIQKSGKYFYFDFDKKDFFEYDAGDNRLPENFRGTLALIDYITSQPQFPNEKSFLDYYEKSLDETHEQLSFLLDSTPRITEEPKVRIIHKSSAKTKYYNPIFGDGVIQIISQQVESSYIKNDDLKNRDYRMGIEHIVDAVTSTTSTFRSAYNIDKSTLLALGAVVNPDEASIKQEKRYDDVATTRNAINNYIEAANAAWEDEALNKPSGNAFHNEENKLFNILLNNLTRYKAFRAVYGTVVLGWHIKNEVLQKIRPGEVSKDGLVRFYAANAISEDIKLDM